MLRQDVPVELTLIGDAGNDRESQEEKLRILEALETTGLVASTRLMGYQSHAVMLREAYGHHVFLQPSVTADNGDTEGGAPVAITEMAASGMPVVATRHCDIPEVLAPAQGRFLAEEHDVAGLAGRLRKLLDDWQGYQPIASALRAHVEENYDLRRQAGNLAALYGEMIGARALA